MANAMRVVACAVVLLGSAASSALAIGPPTAFTGGPEQITTSSALLKGSVYPGDQPTAYYFQYGQTSVYGLQTPSASLLAGKQSVHVTAALSGLQPGTTYHCRLVASNASATVFGKDVAFKTKPVPLSFTLARVPATIDYGRPFAVSGSLTGTGSVGSAVVLQANPLPRRPGFAPIGAPATVASDGGFSLSAPGLLGSAALRVATSGAPSVHSEIMIVRVAVRVTLHVAPSSRPGHPRLYGLVWPAQNGAPVRIQLLRHGRPIRTLALTRLTRAGRDRSRFSVVLRRRVHPGLLRALAGALDVALVEGHSRPVFVR